MYLKRLPPLYLILLPLVTVFLASCNQAAQINVSCDVNDLIGAMNTANANSDTTRLVLDANCTYSFTDVDNDYGNQGPNALPLVNTNIVIEGNNATLLRDTGKGMRFFFITDNGSLRIEDLTLENGYAFASPIADTNARGGAIYNNGGAFRAVRSAFLENQALHGEGGAIYNLGILTSEETLFELNVSDNGGAIFHAGTLNTGVVLEDMVFDTNIAQENGGAIYNGSATTDFLIAGSLFDSNHSAENGGAFFMESGELDISNSEFIENKAGYSHTPSVGDGGAIYSMSGEITVLGSEFYDQKAVGRGGTFFTAPSSDLRLLDSWMEVSHACQAGGGLYLQGESEVEDTTLKESMAGGTEYYWGNTDPWTSLGCNEAMGGAVYNTGTLIINRSLINGYSAFGEGDGVYNTGDLTIINSTFHSDWNKDDAINNHGTTGVSFSTFVRGGLYNSGTMTTKNIVVTDVSDGCLNTGNFTPLGENAALDPACPFSMIFANHWDLDLSLSLSDNGGPTLTHLVKDDSPLIDSAECRDVNNNTVNEDQRGESRPYPYAPGDKCDIGAFEKHVFSTPIAPPPPPPAPEDGEPSGEEADCDPFAGMEISVYTLAFNPDTLSLPVYLRFNQAVPDIGEDGTVPYWGTLGGGESYMSNQQGFENRVYFMFYMQPKDSWTVQDLVIYKDGCDNSVFTQLRLTVPEIQQGASENQPDTTCQKDLGQRGCEEAGGTWFTGVDKPYCLCP